jgi:DNA-binding HxlR family transcriptional regulator
LESGPTGVSGNGAEGAVEAVCPHFHAAVELIGRRWTGAILFALTDRAHFFRELRAAVPGVSDRLLSQRLRELESEGLVERSVHPGTPPRVSYELTDAGRGLEPALRELYEWAQNRRPASAPAAPPSV